MKREYAEDTSGLKEKIKENLVRFNQEELLYFIKKSGKISTRQLFKEIIN